MTKKHLLLLVVVLLTFLSSAYFYKQRIKSSAPTQNVNQTFWEWNNNTNSQSMTMHGTPFTDACKKNPDSKGCKSYDSVDGSADTHCDCIVTHNNKTYTDAFDMKITFEYTAPYHGKNFSDTDFHGELFNKYCDFVCQDFAEKIKNESIVE